MNNYIPSGTSLFDVLSMVIPGGLIIAFFADIFGVTINPGKNEVVFYILVFVSSYLVGLMWNELMNFLTRRFRTNDVGIKIEKDRFLNKIRQGGDNRTKWHKLFLSIFPWNKKPESNIVDAYLKAYSKITNTPTYNLIIIIETQVAFIKNMLFIILVYGIYLEFFVNENIKVCAGLFKCYYPKTLGIFLFVIFGVLVIVMICRQQRIYYFIWQRYHYDGNNLEQNESK